MNIYVSVENTSIWICQQKCLKSTNPAENGLQHLAIYYQLGECIWPNNACHFLWVNWNSLLSSRDWSAGLNHSHLIYKTQPRECVQSHKQLLQQMSLHPATCSDKSIQFLKPPANTGHHVGYQKRICSVCIEFSNNS